MTAEAFTEIKFIVNLLYTTGGIILTGLWGHWLLSKRKEADNARKDRAAYNARLSELEREVLTIQKTMIEEDEVRAIFDEKIAPLNETLGEIKVIMGDVSSKLSNLQIAEAKRRGREEALQEKKRDESNH